MGKAKDTDWRKGVDLKEGVEFWEVKKAGEKTCAR